MASRSSHLWTAGTHHWFDHHQQLNNHCVYNFPRLKYSSCFQNVKMCRDEMCMPTRTAWAVSELTNFSVESRRTGLYHWALSEGIGLTCVLSLRARVPGTCILFMLSFKLFALTLFIVTKCRGRYRFPAFTHYWIGKWVKVAHDLA